MSDAERTCLQATRLFALAIKAREDGNSDYANEPYEARLSIISPQRDPDREGSQDSLCDRIGRRQNWRLPDDQCGVVSRCRAYPPIQTSDGHIMAMVAVTAAFNIWESTTVRIV